MTFYLMILRPEGPQMFGPFPDEQSRDDFASALWWNEPARMPWQERGFRRTWFKRDSMHLYYLQVTNNRLGNPTNVTVSQLANGKASKKHLAKEPV